MRAKFFLLTIAAPLFAIATPAHADVGDPIVLDDGTEIDIIANARLRYEAVDQDNLADGADALTARLRAGVELKTGILSVLAEGEGTFALLDDFNDTLPGNGIEPFPVVADPDNLEINRLQFAIKDGGTGVTVGRQRIILDNSRFVGNVGWRQNEQTFDGVRGQIDTGPVTLDATYSVSQRTIFGVDSPSEYFNGDFWFVNGGIDLSVVDVTAFAYLVDYDTRLAFSSQTYGLLAKAEVELPGFKLAAEASYASQSDYMGNPVQYRADYFAAKLGGSVFGFGLTAGYEELGSDAGIAAFQTPMATLHAFQGWADIFLTTPANGVRDYHVTIGRNLDGIGLLPGLTANVTYHQFDSAFGGFDYGSEWDASVGFKAGPVSLLAKYANFNSDGFAVDTEKLWLQAEVGF